MNLKGLVWYPKGPFQRAGYSVRTTLDGLMKLSAQMVADGRTPWCMGLESGTADGWPATDWIENLLLGSAGPGAYDRWTSHQTPFDDPAVRRAFRRFGRMILADHNLVYGVDVAVRTHFGQAQLPMEADPPGCWLYTFPSLFAGFEESAGKKIGAFRFRIGSAILGHAPGWRRCRRRVV